MVKKKNEKSTYVGINSLVELSHNFLERYPGLEIEIQLYHKNHGGTFIFVYNGKTIARIYPLKEGGIFTLQYTKDNETKTIPVGDQKTLAKVQRFIEYNIGKTKMEEWSAQNEKRIPKKKGENICQE